MKLETKKTRLFMIFQERDDKIQQREIKVLSPAVENQRDDNTN